MIRKNLDYASSSGMRCRTDFIFITKNQQIKTYHSRLLHKGAHVLFRIHVYFFNLGVHRRMKRIGPCFQKKLTTGFLSNLEFQNVLGNFLLVPTVRPSTQGFGGLLYQHFYPLEHEY